MMETNDAVCKSMMLKFKESFSLKSFSSKSYHSSLVCNSKTIRMDVNLINGKVITSANAFSGPNFSLRSSGNVSKKNQRAFISHEKKAENSEVKNESSESSRAMKISPKSENMKELLKIRDSVKSSTEDGKLKLKTSVKHMYQANSSSSFNRTQTSAKLNCSEFESFRCDVCMKYFSTKRSVKRHSVLHSLERHPFETCGKVFPTKENLKRHCGAIHEVKISGQSDQMKSPFPGTNFPLKGSGNVSEKRREVSFCHEKMLEISEVQNKSSESSSVMKISPKSENMTELLKIRDSLKSSTEDGKLKLKTSVKHTYQANSNSSLDQIQTKAELNCSEYESFRCDVCMKYFSSKRTVKRHSALHSLERHPCETCGKVFPTKEYLKRHCRAIHEVRLFKCSKCYKSFSRKSYLNKHLKRHFD